MRPDIHCHGALFREDQHDILTVCDWGQKLSYYHLNGKQVYLHIGACEHKGAWGLGSLITDG